MGEETLGKINNKIEESPVGREAHWPKVLFYTYLQLLGLYGVILVFTEAYLSTTFFCLLLVWLGVIGVNAGAHRLWAHNSYMATTPLKIFLMFGQTLAGQGPIYDWVLYHRLHHKHFGTNQDPYNPKKGFFYSHFLSLTRKVTAEQEEQAKEIGMADLEEDAVVMFQKKYYWLLYVIISVTLPVYIPLYYWRESLLCAVFVSGLMRYAITLQFAWLIHSATRIFGLKEDEKFPADSNTVFLFYKTHWLQYHYLAPWDYQTGEYGKYGTDFASVFIRVCAALDFATDLRTVSSAAVKEALAMTLETNKPIPQCLLEAEKAAHIPADHYLHPKKFY